MSRASSISNANWASAMNSSLQSVSGRSWSTSSQANSKASTGGVSMSSSQWNREASELIRLLVLRGYTANQASNFARTKYAKLVKTQEQRLKMNQAVQRAKNAVKRAGGAVRNASARAGTAVVAAGIAAGQGGYRAVRAPNRGARRGFFGAMQRVQQYRANKQQVPVFTTKFAENIKKQGNARKQAFKNAVEAETRKKVANHNARVNAEVKKLITQFQTKAAKAETKKKSLLEKASFWGGKKGGIRF